MSSVIQSRVIQISPSDSVAVVVDGVPQGTRVQVGNTVVDAISDIPAGHKLALREHAEGDAVIKYGWPIGRATRPIRVGEHVHSHNVRSALTHSAELSYQRNAHVSQPKPLSGTFRGFERPDGRAGTRNELWIIPTVGCVAKTAEALASSFSRRLGEFPNVEGVHAFSHVHGCSQLGNDLDNTQKILAALATHPNAGGVLVLGLGCESNHFGVFKPHLNGHAQERLRFLSTQQATDEYEAGLSLLEELAQLANNDVRRELPLSRLVVGLKCGGSDGFSGITANPLLGRFSSRIVSAGGSAVLTEVPEMFGAEGVLFSRCTDSQVFERATAMVNDFRRYFTDHHQPVDENPSPGNKDGGITSLEEKSLGCVQKGGDAPITDVIPYGGKVTKPGLTLLDGPGNDQVSTTALVAAGAAVVLFTTGRGTPLGSPVPTIKVASNTKLAEHKPGWIDFNAGALLDGASSDALDDQFADKVLSVASGSKARNEERGYREIAIFKSGVTL